MKSMQYLAVILLAVCALSMSGCAGMSTREQSTLSGGAIGAGGGAFLGAISGGRPAVGAIVGGAAGALTGYILGDQGGVRRRR